MNWEEKNHEQYCSPSLGGERYFFRLTFAHLLGHPSLSVTAYISLKFPNWFSFSPSRLQTDRQQEGASPGERLRVPSGSSPHCHPGRRLSAFRPAVAHSGYRALSHSCECPHCHEQSHGPRREAQDPGGERAEADRALCGCSCR